jgi:hypothetical protein
MRGEGANPSLHCYAQHRDIGTAYSAMLLPRVSHFFGGEGGSGELVLTYFVRLTLTGIGTILDQYRRRDWDEPTASRRENGEIR